MLTKREITSKILSFEHVRHFVSLFFKVTILSIGIIQ